MKVTDNAGIDYGLGRSNVDKATGIRYGVISQHSVSSWSIDDIMTNGTDAAYEDAVAQLQKEHDVADDDDEGEAALDEAIESLNENWETDIRNFVYEDDGVKVTGCMDSDLFVIKSPVFTYAQFCSPCVPGAGNLDSYCPSGVRTYALPSDWFEDGVAPYPLFSVETGEPVPAATKD